jgi:hypothetical protein
MLNYNDAKSVANIEYLLLLNNVERAVIYAVKDKKETVCVYANESEALKDELTQELIGRGFSVSWNGDMMEVSWH